MNDQVRNKEFWLGVDIAKNSFEAALAPIGCRPDQWASLPVSGFAMTAEGAEELGQWVSERLCGAPCVGVCVESTGIYSVVFAELVGESGLPPVAIVNPRLPVAFARSLGLRDKCDRVDAAVLALYGVVHQPRPRPARAEEYEHLRMLWRLQEDLQEDLVRWSNRLEQTRDGFVRRQIRGTVRHLTRQLERAWEAIQDWVSRHESLRRDVELMVSVPGVGFKTAALMLAEYGDLRSWTRGELVSYGGLYPRLYESGHSVHRRPRLAGGGGKRIRKGLFLPACCLKRCACPVGDFGRHLEEAGKSKMCAIGAMMRKLLLVLRAVLRSGTPYDPNYAKATIRA